MRGMEEGGGGAAEVPRNFRIFGDEYQVLTAGEEGRVGGGGGGGGGGRIFVLG